MANDDLIHLNDLHYYRINGIRATNAYGKNFIEVFHHNVKYQKPFENEIEANYSLQKNKFSLLSLIDEKFINEDNNPYEFLLIYKEKDIIMHWKQNLSMHTLTSNVGYEKLHIDNELKSFYGLAHSKTNESYIDGQPSSDDWWYAIGVFQLFGSYIPGPRQTIGIIVFDVSLFVRFNYLYQLQQFPNLSFCSIRKRECKFFNFILLLMIIIILKTN